MRKEGFAIVTGGSRGLGKAMALRLAREGYDLVINYVSNDSAKKAEEVVEEIKKLGAQAIAVQADVSDYAACKKIVDEGVAAFGRKIAVQVNIRVESGRASWNRRKPEYKRMINVACCTNELFPCRASNMIDANKGCIIIYLL